MKFRKKPVVIAALQFAGTAASAVEIFEEFDVPGATYRPDLSSIYGPNGTLHIPTLEGEMTASPGDWIIRGVKGEFYPCKPEIFAATYEPA